MNALFISLFFGGCIALAFWLVYFFFARVPAEDRHFLDRPALGFRLVWPVIQALVFYGGHWVSDARASLILSRLKRAGVEYSISPQQFLAAKIVSAMGFAGIAILLAMMLPGTAYLLGLPAAIAGFFYPELWLKETGSRRTAAILRTLPFYLDVITLAVESGSNLTGALTQAVQKTSDSVLRKEFSRVLRDIRSGKTRAEALRDLTERTGSVAIGNVVTGLIQAERTGASLGPLLRAQASQLRAQRFQQAEKKAMEAPVKMLGPLVLFIFPTTALVIGFLLLSKAIMEGLVTWQPLLWAYHWPG